MKKYILYNKITITWCKNILVSGIINWGYSDNFVFLGLHDKWIFSCLHFWQPSTEHQISSRRSFIEISKQYIDNYF